MSLNGSFPRFSCTVCVAAGTSPNTIYEREFPGTFALDKRGFFAPHRAEREGSQVKLVADQSGGDRGLFVPFFGRLTSTYKSIGLLAMQTGATLVCGMARRLGPRESPPGRPGNSRTPAGSMGYAIAMVDRFGPADWEGQPDPLFYITARYRRAIETMIRKAPDQYFWMHRVWRSRPAHERLAKPFPGALRDKLASLPWMTTSDVDALVARSDHDAANLSSLHR